MPGGYKFHKYPLPTILTRVFCEAFVDHNSVAENDVVPHRDGLNIPGSQLLQFVVLMIMIWVTVVQPANKIMASASGMYVMFRRQI